MNDLHDPVTVFIDSPAEYQRPQLLVRLIIGAGLGLVHQSLFGVFAVLYLLLPGLAAIMISKHGGRGIDAQHATWLVKVIDWLLAFYAYMLFVTDDFPLDAGSRKLRLQLESSGEPTSSEALWRLIASLPHALVLFVLGIVSAGFAMIMAVSVLLTRRTPRALHGFQHAMLGRLARFFAYHSSLVAAYPRFDASAVDVGRKADSAA